MKSTKIIIVAMLMLLASGVTFAGSSISVTNSTDQVRVATIGCSAEMATQALIQFPIYPGATERNVNAIHCSSNKPVYVAVFNSTSTAWADTSSVFCVAKQFDNSGGNYSINLNKSGK